MIRNKIQHLGLELELEEQFFNPQQFSSLQNNNTLATFSCPKNRSKERHDF
jgi:hypothetical protein